MADNSKKVEFEDFLKIYPPLTPKVDKSNYKTFNNFFKKKEKKEENKNDQKNDEEENNLDTKNAQKKNEIDAIEEKDETKNDTDRSKNKDTSSEEDWYLVDKGISLQNKKKKKNK